MSFWPSLSILRTLGSDKQRIEYGLPSTAVIQKRYNLKSIMTVCGLLELPQQKTSDQIMINAGFGGGISNRNSTLDFGVRSNELCKAGIKIILLKNT